MKPDGWQDVLIAQAYKRSGSGAPIDWFAVQKLQDTLRGRRVLFVGNAPSAKDWRDYCSADTYVVAANGAIEQLKDRADMFLTPESTAHSLPWYYTPVKPGAIRVVSGCNLSAVVDSQPAIAVERGWWCWGWKPRVYFDNEVHNPSGTLYKLKNSSWGFDHATGKCWGLLKGPICYPGNMSIGTVLVNGLHLLAFMGADDIHTIGFDLCMAAGHHWNDSSFKFGTSRWIRKECYIKVNGKPTIWHFALSAAYALDFVKPKLHESGCSWIDHSSGLLQEDGIEGLMEYVYSTPTDVEFA